MNLNLKQCKLILKWHDIAVEYEDLKDEDIKLYNKIKESVYEEEDAGDPLVYSKKDNRDYNFSIYESDKEDSCDDYSDCLDIYEDDF